MGPIEVVVGCGIEVPKVEVRGVGAGDGFGGVSVSSVVADDAGVSLDFVQRRRSALPGSFMETVADGLDEGFVPVKGVGLGTEKVPVYLQETAETITEDGKWFRRGNDVT